MPFFKPKPAKAEGKTTIVTTQHFLTPEKIQIIKNPVFGGRKNESFNTFIRQIEMQVETHASDTTKMDMILFRLHENAANTFIEKVNQNPSITFSEMKTEMRKTFPEPLINSLQMIRRRKQLPQESLELYADSIRILVNRFYTSERGYNKTSRDYQMVKYFVYNVRQPIKQKLKKYIKEFKDLDKVLSKAIQIQQEYQSRQVPQMTTQMAQLQILDQPNHQNMQQQNNSHPMQQRQQWQRKSRYWQGRQY